MSDQADVRSIDSLREFRSSLGLFSEEVFAALGAVDGEIRRTLHWLQHDRREYWSMQIKQRRANVSTAQAELFRKKIAQTADNHPSMAEAKEKLRVAEASLRDAEAHVIQVKKWEPALRQAALEYRATVRRIKAIATGDAPRAMVLLQKLIEALDAYVAVSLTPRSSLSYPPIGEITDQFIRDEPTVSEVEASTDVSDDLLSEDSNTSTSNETN